MQKLPRVGNLQYFSCLSALLQIYCVIINSLEYVMLLTTENPIRSILKEAGIAGISIKALCDEADIDPNTVTRWKNNKHSPTYSKISQLQKALEIIKARDINKN